MASVSAEDVRNLVNLAESDISNEKVAGFIEQAGGEVSTEVGVSVDPANCSAGQAAAVRILAALYCLSSVTGGAGSGESFQIGDLRVDSQVSTSQRSTLFEILKERLNKILEQLNEPNVLRS